MIHKITITFLLVMLCPMAYPKDISDKTHKANFFVSDYNSDQQQTKKTKGVFYLGYMEVGYERPDLLREKITGFIYQHPDHTHFVPYSNSGDSANEFTDHFMEVYESLDLLGVSKSQLGQTVLLISQKELDREQSSRRFDNSILHKFDKIVVYDSEHEGGTGPSRSMANLMLELMKKTSESSSPKIFAAEGDSLAREVLTRMGPELRYHINRRFPAKVSALLRLYPTLEYASSGLAPLHLFATSEFALNQKEHGMTNGFPLEVQYSLKNPNIAFYDSRYLPSTTAIDEQFITVKLEDSALINWLELLKRGGAFAKHKILFPDRGWVHASMISGKLFIEWQSFVKGSNKKEDIFVEFSINDQNANLSLLSYYAGEDVHEREAHYYKMESTSPLQIDDRIIIATNIGTAKTSRVHIDPQIAYDIAQQFSSAKSYNIEATIAAITATEKILKARKFIDVNTINQALGQTFSDKQETIAWLNETKLKLEEDAALEQQKHEEHGREQGYFQGFTSCMELFEDV